MLLSEEIAPLVDAQQGTVYPDGAQRAGRAQRGGGDQDPAPARQLRAARRSGRAVPGIGVGLVGQAAAEKQRILLTDVPPDYTQIHSSLGGATPWGVLVLPVLFGEAMAVIELGALQPSLLVTSCSSIS